MNNRALNYIYLTILLLAFAFHVNAGEVAYSVKGVVKEAASGKVLEGAAVRLLTPEDSSFIAGVVSDQKGNFSLNPKKGGAFLVQVSYLGYQTRTKEVLLNRKSSHQVLNFLLKEQTLELSETIVKGKTPEVVVKQDTIEYNADSYKVKEGSPVEELLRKLPGLRIAADGTITIEGKTVSEILVDGRSFFGNDQSLTLKNLPSDFVQKVQVIDRKDKTDEATGFESEEKQKVINLTIKPDKKKGVFGNAAAGYGTSNRYMVNAMVNSFLGEDKTSLLLGTRNLDLDPMLGNGQYSMGEPTRQNVALNINKSLKKGFNIDGDIRFRHNTDKDLNQVFAENLLPDSSYFTKSNTDNRKMERSIQSGFRIEYKKDSSFTFELRPNFQYTYGTGNELSDNQTLDGSRKMVNSSTGSNKGNNNQWNYGLESFISKTLGKKGRNMTLHLNWNTMRSDGKSHRLSTNTFAKAAGDSIVNLDQDRNSLTNNQTLSLRTSYSEPIGKNGALMLSYSISANKATNENNTYSMDEYGAYSILDSLYSRSTSSDRLNQSIGLAFRSKINKIAYSLGISLDPTRFDENTYVGKTSLKDQLQHQLNYSPRFSLHWSDKKGSFMSVSYFGRSSMPTSRQLSPVTEILSPVSEMQGNPDLKNGFRHQLSGNWRLNKRESQLSVILFSNFSVEQNTITSYSIYNPENGKRFSSYRNINGNWSSANTFMLSVPFRNKDYQFSSNTNYMFSQRTGFTNGEENRSKNNMIGQTFSLSYSGDLFYATLDFNAEYSGIKNSLQNLQPQNTWEYGSRLDLRWDLPWDLSFGTAVVYRGKSGYAEGYNRQIVNWDAELSKEFLKSRQASVSLIVMDILGQNDSSSRSISATSISDNRWNSVGRYGMLKFTYRFNFTKGKGNTPSEDTHSISGEEIYY